jgi:uncharacterized membrane-anchored protein YitT (DUF2179 family)
MVFYYHMLLFTDFMDISEKYLVAESVCILTIIMVTLTIFLSNIPLLQLGYKKIKKLALIRQYKKKIARKQRHK